MATNPDNKPKIQIRQASKAQASRLLGALHRFTNGLSTDVRNPLKDKYGKAYESLIAGDASRYREDLETAMSHYRQALVYNKDFNEAYVGLAKCLRRLGDTQGAIRCLSQAIRRNAFHMESHLDIAKCFAECDNATRSIYHYERAIRLEPSNLDARFGLALVVEANGDTDRAIRTYQDIIQQDNEFLPAYNNLGSLYLRINLLDKAEQLFRSLVSKAPDFTRGHLGLAMTLDKAGKCQDALDAYKTVMQLRPDGKNNDFIKQRIVQMNLELGRSRTRQNTTLVRLK